MVFKIGPAALSVACNSCDTADFLNGDDESFYQQQHSFGKKLDKILGLEKCLIFTASADVSLEKNFAKPKNRGEDDTVSLSQDEAEENRNPEDFTRIDTDNLSRVDHQITDENDDIPPPPPPPPPKRISSKNRGEDDTVSLSQDEAEENRNPEDFTRIDTDNLGRVDHQITDENDDIPPPPPPPPPKRISSKSSENLVSALTFEASVILRELQELEASLPRKDTINISSPQIIVLTPTRKQDTSADRSLSLATPIHPSRNRTMTMDELNAVSLKDTLNPLFKYLQADNEQQQQQQQQQEKEAQQHDDKEKEEESTMPKTDQPRLKILVAGGGTEEVEMVVVWPSTAQNIAADMGRPSPMPSSASLYVTPIKAKTAASVAKLSPTETVPSPVTFKLFPTEDWSCFKSDNMFQFLPSPGGTAPTIFSDSVFDTCLPVLVDERTDNDPMFSADLFGEI